MPSIHRGGTCVHAACRLHGIDHAYLPTIQTMYVDVNNFWWQAARIQQCSIVEQPFLQVYSCHSHPVIMIQFGFTRAKIGSAFIHPKRAAWNQTCLHASTWTWGVSLERNFRSYQWIWMRVTLGDPVKHLFGLSHPLDSIDFEWLVGVVVFSVLILMA